MPPTFCASGTFFPFLPLSLSLSSSTAPLLSALLNGGHSVTPTLQGCCSQILRHQPQWGTGPELQFRSLFAQRLELGRKGASERSTFF